MINKHSLYHFLRVISVLLFSIFFCVSCNEKSDNYNKNNKFLANHAELTCLEDLNNKTIAVQLGTTQDAYVTEHFPNAKILRLQTASDVILCLSSGQCDAIFAERNNFNMKIEHENNIGMLKDDVFRGEAGFCFIDDALRQQFNTFLAGIKENGELDAIIKKWESDTSSKMPDLSNVTTENGILKIGTCSDAVPFSFISDNQLVGLDIEIACRFAAYLHKKPVFESGVFSSLIPSLVSNKVEMLCASISITEERKKSVLFSDPYYFSWTVALAHINAIKPQLNAHDFTIDDADGKRIGVLTGSIHDVYATETFKNSTIVRIENRPDLMLSLRTNHCDAVVMDDVTAKFFISHDSSLLLFDKNILSCYYSVGFNLSDKENLDKFNQFLKISKENGVIDSMCNRWFTKGEDALMPTFDFSESDGTILFGSTGVEVPYTFIKNNQPAGFDVELLSRFAQYCHKSPKFDFFSFDGMMNAVITGKVTAVAGSIMVTEERADNVAFSDPYMDVRTVMIFRNPNYVHKRSSSNSSDGHTFFSGIKDSIYSNLIVEDRYKLILNGLGVTLIISLISLLFGTLLGAGICYMRMSSNKIMTIFAKGYIDLLRGIPQVVLLMIMFYVVFATSNLSGIIVASITFAMNFAAYVAEMFRSSIESVPQGQTEGGLSMGFNKLKTFSLIVLPQAIQKVLPVYKGEFISLVKMTSIVGYIAVQDLTKAGDIIRSRTFDAFFPLILVAVIYFILSWLLTLLLTYLEYKTKPKKKTLPTESTSQRS